MIVPESLSTSFALCNPGNTVTPVMKGVSRSIAPGGCDRLNGRSIAGKSTLMRMVRGNHLVAAGRIMVGGLDLTEALPRQIAALGRDRRGHVSRFMRVVPQAAALLRGGATASPGATSRQLVLRPLVSARDRFVDATGLAPKAAA